MEPALKKYPRPARRYQQAHQLWPILTSWAAHRVVGRLKEVGIITYGEAAVLMGYSPQAGRTLAEALGLVSEYCKQSNVPRLNTIVVDFETGVPGMGIPRDYEETDEEMQQMVNRFDWFMYRQPTIRNFRDL
jgi:hypothetical protein